MSDKLTDLYFIPRVINVVLSLFILLFPVFAVGNSLSGCLRHSPIIQGLFIYLFFEHFLICCHYKILQAHIFKWLVYILSVNTEVVFLLPCHLRVPLTGFQILEFTIFIFSTCDLAFNVLWSLPHFFLPFWLGWESCGMRVGSVTFWH